MCWAESFAPTGSRRERSLDQATKSAISATSANRGTVAGDTAGVPSGRPAHLGDPAAHLGAGQVSAGAGLGALTELEVEGLHLVEQRLAPAEPRRRQLVEVARVLGLLLGQHAALARADAGAGLLGAPGQRGLGLLRQRAEAHVADEDRDVEHAAAGRRSARSRRPCRPARRRAAGGGPAGRWRSSSGSHDGNELALDAHRRDRTVVTDPVEPVQGQLVDVGDERLVGSVGMSVACSGARTRRRVR